LASLASSSSRHHEPGACRTHQFVRPVVGSLGKLRFAKLYWGWFLISQDTVGNTSFLFWIAGKSVESMVFPMKGKGFPENVP